MASATPTSSPTPAGPSKDEALVWEARQGRVTGVVAILAGIALIAAQVLQGRAFSDIPRVGVVDGLRDALGEQLSNGQLGLQSAQIAYYDSKAALIIVFAVLSAFAYAGTGVACAYLWRATKHRRPELPRVGLIAALLGFGLYAVSILVAQVGLVTTASSFVAGADKSSQAARDALDGGLVAAGTYLRLPGGILAAFALVIVPLWAMRVGLLSRFLGILGIIAGVLTIFPVLQGGGTIVTLYWLVAVGLLIMDRYPGARPPAWASGEATPWPTQQEVREARARAAAATSVDTPAPPPPLSPDVPKGDASDPRDDRSDAPRPRTSRKRRRG